MRLPPIRTKRLFLRPPRLADGAKMVPLLNDPLIGAYTLVPYPYARKEWVAWIRKQRRGVERRPEGLNFPRVICLGREPVGMIGLRWDEKNRTANIGYWVGRPYRRQGIATEAARAVTDYAFSKLGAEKVWATVYKGNPGSPRVLKNCGMRLEGVLRSHIKHQRGRVDAEYYGVLRREWKAKTGQ